MTDTDRELARLRELAKAATAGPWHPGTRYAFDSDVFSADGFQVADTGGAHLTEDYIYEKLGPGHWATTPGSHVELSQEQEEANAAYIAAANPKAITALCDRLDAWKARAEAAELRLAKAERLLKPFADAVYNDNGDVTVSHASIADYFAAYKFMRDTNV